MPNVFPYVLDLQARAAAGAVRGEATGAFRSGPVAVYARGYWLASGLSWLVGLVGIGLIYHRSQSDAAFVAGVASLLVAISVHRFVRARVSARVALHLVQRGTTPSAARLRAQEVMFRLDHGSIEGHAPFPPRISPIEFD